MNDAGNNWISEHVDRSKDVVSVKLTGPDDLLHKVIFTLSHDGKFHKCEVKFHRSAIGVVDFTDEQIAQAVQVAGWSAQLRLCTDEARPCFAPAFGECHECGADMVKADPMGWAFGHVTGCRSCQRSYCD